MINTKRFLNYFTLESYIRKSPGAWQYIYSSLVAIVASLIVYTLEMATKERFSNLSSVLVISVMFAAIYYGKGPGIWNAFICSILFDFLVVPPFADIASGADNTLKFIIFLITALMASAISNVARSYAKTLYEREEHIRALYEERSRLQEEKDIVLREKEREMLRSALLSSVSHDLKTPLASIIGASSSYSMLESKLTKKQKDTLLGTIQQEATRLNSFVTNILEIARFESGNSLLKNEEIDIDDVIDLALKNLSQTLGKYKIKVDINPELPAIKGDIVALNVVFINLLDNAIKYSPKGSEISIKAYTSLNNIKIDVEDEGVGISRYDLEKIFHKFYRAMSRDSTIAGTGLGLSICKSIIEAHGGSISAHIPDKNYGTKICITLPILNPKNIPAV